MAGRDVPRPTPVRRSAFKMLDLPTFGIPATSITILSSGPFSGRFASSVDADNS